MKKKLILLILSAFFMITMFAGCGHWCGFMGSCGRHKRDCKKMDCQKKDSTSNDSDAPSEI